MKKPSMRPHHAIIGLGVLIALFTALSGVAASIFKFHDDSPITREVFENIPGSIKFAFYLVENSPQLKQRCERYQLTFFLTFCVQIFSVKGTGLS